MNNVEKLLDRIPHPDGSWRRRFLCGLIFLSVTLLQSTLVLRCLPQPVSGDVLGGLQLPEVLRSPQLLLVVALFVFAVGSIIDAITEGYIVRGVSITLGALNALIDWVPPDPRWKYGLWVTAVSVASVALWPLSFVLATLANTAGYKRLYTMKLLVTPMPGEQCETSGTQSVRASGKLSPEALQFFRQLPANMQAGLNEPFGDAHDAAWQMAVAMAPASQRSWLQQLRSRNLELASFLSSAILGLLASLCCSLPQVSWYDHRLIGSYVLLCFLSYLFFGYVGIVQRSVGSVLECLSMAEANSLRE